uniref:Peptidase metallopeptidase domain-containing protein n=1 Tax=Timema douglasi TaxID=61478 RepID=A0A7R8VT97_TIMDO|nr:unnamed protein product [Timema douglasi]
MTLGDVLPVSTRGDSNYQFQKKSSYSQILFRVTIWKAFSLSELRAYSSVLVGEKGFQEAISNTPWLLIVLFCCPGSRWRVKALTYRISKYPSTSRINKEDVDKELNNAFNVWAGVTDLSFTQKDSGQVHIEIRFEKGEHGDGDPFDGPGGTLAHAYFPVYGGDAHFDDAETWTIQSYRDKLYLCLTGTNLFQVAAHEFGHSLGLSHSDVKSALMAPFYRGYEPIFKLDQDDVQGIQVGKPSRRDRLPAIHETHCLRDIGILLLWKHPRVGWGNGPTRVPVEHPRLTPNPGELEQSPAWIPPIHSDDVTTLTPGALRSAVRSSTKTARLTTRSGPDGGCPSVLASTKTARLTTRSGPDDLEAVPLFQALYGKKSKAGSDDHTTSSTTEQSGRDGEGVNSEEDPILCKDGSVDTMFNSAEGVTYVFKAFFNIWFKRPVIWVDLGYNFTRKVLVSSGVYEILESKSKKCGRSTTASRHTRFVAAEHWSRRCVSKRRLNRINRRTVVHTPIRSTCDNYWKLTADGVAANYPRLIARSWKGLPGDMDAAFTYRNGKTYFFKGDQYWRYIGKKMDGEYPKPISEGFTGIPDNLDAAMVWGGNGKIYFYKGESRFVRERSGSRPVGLSSSRSLPGPRHSCLD